MFARHGTKGTWYAHASVGCLHVRPVLNMKDPADVRTMRAVAEECFCPRARIQRLAQRRTRRRHRAQRIQRAMFGARIVRAFETVKDAFDPTNMLNPGRVVRPPRMDDRTLFRYAPGYAPIAGFTPKLDWSDHPGPLGGMLGAVEMCNNNGTCRAFDAGVMCPSFRVTRDETHLTRGRANTLRLALTGQLGADAMASDALADAMKLCVSCKACRRECPTGVDMAKMKLEVLAARAERHGVPRRESLIAELPRYAPILRRVAPLMNLRNRLPPLRPLAQRMLGHCRGAPRCPPGGATPSATTKRCARTAHPRGEVVLLADTFNRYFEPENLRAALRVLAAAGYRAVLPPHRGRPLCCGRTFLAAGMLEQARAEARRTLGRLRRRPAGDRAGAVLPADLARRVPLAAAGARGRRTRRTRDAVVASSWLAKSPIWRCGRLPPPRMCTATATRNRSARFPRRWRIAARAGPDGEADRVVVLRHGRQLRLPGGDAGRVARHGGSLAAAGGARRGAGGHHRRRRHLLPAPDPRSGRARGGALGARAGARAGVIDARTTCWTSGSPATHASSRRMVQAGPGVRCRLRAFRGRIAGGARRRVQPLGGDRAWHAGVDRAAGPVLAESASRLAGLVCGGCTGACIGPRCGGARLRSALHPVERASSICHSNIPRISLTRTSWCGCSRRCAWRWAISPSNMRIAIAT